MFARVLSTVASEPHLWPDRFSNASHCILYILKGINMKVLIADDDKDLCQLLGAVLRSQGHEVFFAFDAAQALILAKNQSPDIIALDINMPGGTGMGALQKIKMNMKTSMIPVLVISANSYEQNNATMLQMGAAEYMQKPLDSEKFCEALYRLTGLPAAGAAAQG